MSLLGYTTIITSQPENAAWYVAKAYHKGVSFIAFNDEPTYNKEEHLEEISGMLSVLSISEAFGVEPSVVAADVLALRKAG